MTRRHDDEDSPLDGRGVLRDGRTFRVGMQFRDQNDDDVAAHFSALQTIDAGARCQQFDGTRAAFHDVRGMASGYRPGFIIPRVPIANDPREAAYREVEARDASAWRTPPRRDADPDISRAGSSQFTTPEGSPCMTDDKRVGTLQRVDGKPVCVAADETRTDSRPITDERERLYRMVDWEAANSWRGESWMQENRPAEFRR
jgi:hypothetical protein